MVEFDGGAFGGRFAGEAQLGSLEGFGDNGGGCSQGEHASVMV